MLTLPQLPLAIAAQFCAKPSTTQFKGGLSYVYVHCADGVVRVCGTDGHVAVTVTFPFGDYAIPGGLYAFPLGAYSKKPNDAASVALTYAADAGGTATLTTPKGTATESLPRLTETPLTEQGLQAIRIDPAGCLSDYGRVVFNPALLARICKAAGTHNVTLCKVSRLGANVYTWQLPESPALPSGANCVALLMPIHLRGGISADPHTKYEVVHKPD